MKFLFYMALIGSIVFVGCERALMAPNPSTDNVSIFEEYWKLVDEKFAMFSDPGKNINKQKLYSENRAKVTKDISSDSLFNVLANITLALKDGHSTLINLEKADQFVAPFQGDTSNLDPSIINTFYFIGGGQTQGEGLKYSLLKNHNIGYIQYRSFDYEVTTDMMNAMLNDLHEAKGIIFDVRGNGGGDPTFAAIMASHFTEHRTYLGYENFKTGPKENDFTKSEIYLETTKGTKYLKPLVVLTDAGCFSATTALIYHLNPLPQVTFIGVKTAGGSGFATDGYLANGWYWSISASEFIDWEGRRLDNGFEPDIEASLDRNDMSKDEIIERAIQELN